MVMLSPLVILFRPYFKRPFPEGLGEGEIKLPEPRLTGEMSVEEIIVKRRSVGTIQMIL